MGGEFNNMFFLCGRSIFCLFFFVGGIKPISLPGDLTFFGFVYDFVYLITPPNNIKFIRHLKSIKNKKILGFK